MDNKMDLLAAALWRNDSYNGTADSEPLDSMNYSINLLFIGIVFIVMVSLGCTMEMSKIRAHMVKPKGVGIAVVAQYGIMPLTAFCLAKAFQLTEMSAVVVLICGCCPGGTLSNILTLALKGDMNLSIVMTTCSTVLAMGMMPLMLYLYCQGFDLHEAVPYLEIFISLVVILFPCGIGIFINYYRPQYSKTITRVGLSISTLCLIAATVLICIKSGNYVLLVLSPSLLSIGAVMPFIGYTFGYVISSLFRLKQAERRTIAMETGCQNNQLCITIIRMAFPPAAVGTLFLFPMVYVIFQFTEAVLLIVIFRCHEHWAKKKEKKMYSPANTAVEVQVLPEVSVSKNTPS